MSTLSQFFGSGGGSAIPAEILVVDGGVGASCVCINCGTQGTRDCRIQGAGGRVSRAYFNVTPGVTCPITVGAGGDSACRNSPYPTSHPYFGALNFCCCLGGSGCASKFGDFGGIDKPQPAPGPVCGPCNIIRTPYQAIYPGLSFLTRTNTCSFTNGAEYYTCCPGINITYGNHGGANTIFSTGGCTGTGPYQAIDSAGAQGIVSKITGTVQTYGAAKVAGGPAGTPYATYTGREHPNSIGPGSGHGAYFCGTGIEAAAPGTVIIQYPNDFDAATTSSPNVCDCSPATPGFRTYRFLCPGSITFP